MTFLILNIGRIRDAHLTFRRVATVSAYRAYFQFLLLVSSQYKSADGGGMWVRKPVANDRGDMSAIQLGLTTWAWSLVKVGFGDNWVAVRKAEFYFDKVPPLLSAGFDILELAVGKGIYGD